LSSQHLSGAKLKFRATNPNVGGSGLADFLSGAFIALDIPGGKGRREVNNDIDGVSGRGGEPDTGMAGRPDRVVADRKANQRYLKFPDQPISAS
jgi:hypothetical protein